MPLTAALRRRLRERTTLPRDVLVLGLIAFCVAVGFGVLVPVLPVFARGFGVGNAEVGAVISVFALMRLAVSPLCGRLIGWLGERTVLATGIFIVAASSGLAGAAQTYPQLLALRGIGGVGSAMFTVSAMSLLLGSVSPQMRGRAAGFFQGGFLLGGMTGPAIGGLLAVISIRAPFFFYAATLAVAGVVGLLLLSRTRVDRAAENATPPVPLRTVLADPRFQAACLTNLAQGWTSFGVRSALIPVLVVEVLHHNTTWTGIAFACAAVAQTIALAPAGKFVDTVGRRPAMIGGGLLAGVSIMVVPFAADHGRADRRPLRVRGRGRLPGDGPRRLGGRCDRRRPRDTGGGVLDVLRHRGHRRTDRGWAAGRQVVVRVGVRSRRCPAGGGGDLLAADAPRAAGARRRRPRTGDRARGARDTAAR